MAGFFSEYEKHNSHRSQGITAAVRNIFTSNEDDDNFLLEDEIRTVLIGKTGEGKSETGNTILGKTMFKASFSGESETKKCRLKDTVRENKKLIVVDTPGFFDTTTSVEDTEREVAKCIGITSPGPHCFLLVISIGRFTPEDRNAVNTMLKLFGEDVHKYVIIVFTKLDKIRTKDKPKDKLAKYFENIPDELESLLKRCENRCIAFDNTATLKKREKQFKLLFNMIQETVKKNNGLHYTNEMFEKAEQIIQMKIEEEKQIAIEKEQKLVDEISTVKEKEATRTIEAVRLTLSEDMKEKIHHLEQSAKEREQKIMQEIADAKEIEMKQKLDEEREKVEKEKQKMREDLIRKDIEIKQTLDEERKKVEKEKELMNADIKSNKETAKEEKRKLEEAISKLNEDMKESIMQLEKDAKEREQNIKQKITDAKDFEIKQKLDEERTRIDKEIEHIKAEMMSRKDTYNRRKTIRKNIENEEKITGQKVIKGIGTVISGVGKFALQAAPIALEVIKVVK